MAWNADDLDARMREIVENLRRAELSVTQREEQIAEHARLAKEKRTQVASKLREGGPESDEFLSLVRELNDPGGRSIQIMAPELAAAIWARKNVREVEGLLLLILSSPKARQSVWLTRPIYNPETGVLPESGAHIRKKLIEAAEYPNPPDPARLCAEKLMDAFERVARGFVVTPDVSAMIVDTLEAGAPRLDRSEDSAEARKGRRRRKELGISRPRGKPKAEKKPAPKEEAPAEGASEGADDIGGEEPKLNGHK
jgi:hypothetical protein